MRAFLVVAALKRTRVGVAIMTVSVERARGLWPGVAGVNASRGCVARLVNQSLH
jgi:hypothetical protein